MDINKPDIWLPENILSCVQELGRAGRNGGQSQATVLFRERDMSHTNDEY